MAFEFNDLKGGIFDQDNPLMKGEGGYNKNNLMKDLFVGSNDGPVESSQTVDIEMLHPSDNNVFNVSEDEAMDELIASIKENGILQPLIVRNRAEGGYEVVSGHRRLYASHKLGLTRLPVDVKDLSDEDRDIYIVDSNLHRPNISIAEKAKAVSLKYNAIKKKVGRNYGEKSNCAPGAQLENSKSSAEIIAEQMGISSRQVNNLIAIAKLDGEVLRLVDCGKIPLKAGVQISYTSPKLQEMVANIVDCENVKINEETAKKLKDLPEDASIDDLSNLLKGCTGIEHAKKQSISLIRLPKTIASRYFDKGTSKEDMNEKIIEIMDGWMEIRNLFPEDYTDEQVRDALKEKI